MSVPFSPHYTSTTLADPPPTSNAYNILQELLLGCALFFICLYVTRGMGLFVDLSNSDENSYALIGQLLPDIALSANWGPLYSCWYAFLMWLTKDPIQAFITNAQLLYLSSTLLFYCALRAFKVSSLFTLAIVWLYSISFAAVLTFPRIYQCSFLLLVATTIYSRLSNDIIRKLAIMATGIMYCSYIRPELAVVACVLWIAVLYQVSRQYLNRERVPLDSVVIFLIISILPLIIFGSPLLATQQNRFFEAFSQGFALTIQRTENSQINPYLEHAKVVSEYFGNIDSVQAALTRAPEIFFRHIGLNIQALISFVPSLVTRVFGSSSSFGQSVLEYAWILPLSLLGLAMCIGRRLVGISLEGWILAFTFLVTFAAAITTIVDYRHVYYLAMLALLAAIPCYPQTSQGSLLSLGGGLLLASAICVVSPEWPKNTLSNEGNSYIPNRDLINEVRQALTKSSYSSISICPAYLAPYIDTTYAVPFSQTNSLVEETRNLVVIGKYCDQNERTHRNIEQFENSAHLLGFSKTVEKNGLGTIYTK